MNARKIGRATVSALVVLGTASLASPARAAHHEKDETPMSYTALMKMDPVDVMHMIDKEKKGYVTRDEFLKFQAALFDNIDRNKDRRLSAPEFTDQG
jgi:hypothetical protein